MDKKEAAVLQELGERYNEANEEDKNFMLTVIAAYRAGIETGKARAAS